MIWYGWTRQSTVGGFLSWLFTGPHWPQITYYAHLCSSPREWENQSADLRPGETDKEGFRCSCCYWHVHEQHKGTCVLAVACRGYQVVVTDCKCAAGLVASPLGLRGPQMSGCVCMHDSGVCGRKRLEYGQRCRPYSNLFLSLIIVWSNVKPKPCFLSQFFPPSSTSWALWQSQHGLPAP